MTYCYTPTVLLQNVIPGRASTVRTIRRGTSILNRKFRDLMFPPMKIEETRGSDSLETLKKIEDILSSLKNAIPNEESGTIIQLKRLNKLLGDQLNKYFKYFVDEEPVSYFQIVVRMHFLLFVLFEDFTEFVNKMFLFIKQKTISSYEVMRSVLILKLVVFVLIHLENVIDNINHLLVKTNKQHSSKDSLNSSTSSTSIQDQSMSSQSTEPFQQKFVKAESEFVPVKSPRTLAIPNLASLLEMFKDLTSVLTELPIATKTHITNAKKCTHVRKVLIESSSTDQVTLNKYFESMFKIPAVLFCGFCSAPESYSRAYKWLPLIYGLTSQDFLCAIVHEFVVSFIEYNILYLLIMNYYFNSILYLLYINYYSLCSIGEDEKRASCVGFLLKNWRRVPHAFDTVFMSGVYNIYLEINALILTTSMSPQQPHVLAEYPAIVFQRSVYRIPPRYFYLMLNPRFVAEKITEAHVDIFTQCQTRAIFYSKQMRRAGVGASDLKKKVDILAYWVAQSLYETINNISLNATFQEYFITIILFVYHLRHNLLATLGLAIGFSSFRLNKQEKVAIRIDLEGRRKWVFELTNPKDGSYPGLIRAMRELGNPCIPYFGSFQNIFEKVLSADIQDVGLLYMNIGKATEETRRNRLKWSDLIYEECSCVDNAFNVSFRDFCETPWSDNRLFDPMIKSTKFRIFHRAEVSPRRIKVVPMLKKYNGGFISNRVTVLRYVKYLPVV
ncbi:hypothetical protein EIN_398120 [Entamoeba invadens IP1]|uniref:Ras-GEF domain-containing protein n=1 Tax=Entamoeba invadens IP1 TaxID=370355 RepID=A0A0A1UA26_ENTIV|nr:hypothetical protein EIN_398120 [Entamoeba invadens IP1]ELP91882.1 hypothetical protein EIN_398120 [Entamoeba invadens IP1]|eukprot:XP_004258653.1 hypothetical protein EIN_398120 [Entamoeba invadens IP1]